MIYTMLAVAVLALTIVPVGGAVFVLGFVFGDSPCVMCWEQRIGMALIALIGLFVLRYGPRPKYAGAGVLVGAWGVHMAIRHMALHAARDVGQGFSLEVLGAHTYTWSLFIFWASIVLMGILLLMTKTDEIPTSPRTLRPLERAATVVFLVVIGANAVQAFASTGPPPFAGQGDPVRFSFNPANWVWSLEEWRPAPISLRGRWAIEKPSVPAPAATADAESPANLPVLQVKERRELSLPLAGTPTGLDHDAESGRFLMTTQNGVYILSGSFDRIERHTVIDKGYSVDLGRFAGAAFLGPDTVMAIGENKSYVVLRENDQADAARNFRYFLESFDKFDEVSRSRFQTVRARMMYTMSLAFDPASQSIYTVTVPNRTTKRLVVSRFDRRDMTLSEEFVLAVAPDSGLEAGRAWLDSLYVTGAAIHDGRLYALSAARSTLLTIDLATRAVVAAHEVSGLDRPAGLAVAGGDFYVACEDGTIVVVDGASVTGGM